MNQGEALAEVRAGRVSPVYLIYGDEKFLEEELMQAIRAAIVQPETADFNYQVHDPAPDQLASAINMAQTQPFFAERRLVVVRDCPAFGGSVKAVAEDGEEKDGGEKGGAGDELLLSYLKQPCPSTCLLFLAGEKVDSRRRVTKAVTAAGVAVDCKALKEPEALTWVQERGKRYGKKVDATAARSLLERVGTHLRMLDMELNKLSVYVGDAREITQADVEAAVGGAAETEVFRLTEAIMLKQRTKALELLERTLRQVDHPLQLLGAIASRFRQMLLVKALVARRVSQKEGPGMVKMHPYAYSKMTEHVRPYGRDEIVQGMVHLLEADLAIKTGADPKLTLETTVAMLMG